VRNRIRGSTPTAIGRISQAENERAAIQTPRVAAMSKEEQNQQLVWKMKRMSVMWKKVGAEARGKIT
jgi:hypothetical protein